MSPPISKIKKGQQFYDAPFQIDPELSMITAETTRVYMSDGIKEREGWNATFRGANPTWANACVGDNGSPDLREYAEGFAAAANLLISAVIKSRGLKNSADLFIYPICFNMRHATELFLKKAIEDLFALASIRGRNLPPFESKKSHALDRIWAFVKEHSVQIDRRYEKEIEELDPYIRDIASVDATGQVFRYPTDTEYRKHLADIAVINVINVGRRFKVLEFLLIQLNRFNEDLLDEYRWNTFTRNLSRSDLKRIASELPQKREWTNPMFAEKSAEIRAKYELSANEYSKALNLIKERHEMAGPLGIRVIIPNYSSSETEAILQSWLQIHGIGQLRSSYEERADTDWNEQASIEDALEYTRRSDHVVDELVENLSPDHFAVVSALFYFDSEPRVSEAFERLLKSAQRDAEIHKRDKRIFWNSVDHIISKTSLIHSVLNSLNFLFQTDELEQLIRAFELQDIKHKILEKPRARNTVKPYGLSRFGLPGFNK